MALLEKIKAPEELKKLPVEELPKLAEEIRRKIIEVVYKNGGHLGSNLGVIELTIALHYVFNFPQDRIAWDVSHQCYTHKILSGRLDKIDTLRMGGGLSGFTAPEESPYDSFKVGHAGTSVSTALGIACANGLLKNNNKAIAVLGDGALTAGMTFEALNHAGTVKPDLIVILNDNKMSISRTIGSMANYLNKLRTTHLYQDVKNELYRIAESLPKVGQTVGKTIGHLRSSAMSFLGGFIFEELGFSYYGPVDGHNIPKMIQLFREIQKLKQPILIHVITEKGKGSELAMKDPCNLHGMNPVKYSDDGKVSLRQNAETYTDVFARSAAELARENSRIVAITAAMPEGTGLVEFEKAYPNRYFDVGICEQHALGLAAGLAKQGLKPIAGIYSTFLQRAFDQLFQEVALQKNHIVFTMDRAGLVGSDGATHHGVFDIAYLRMFPEFVLMSPKDGSELTQMLAFALTLNQPVFIRYPRTETPKPLFTQSAPLALAKSEILKDGRGGAILAYGSMVYPAYTAAEVLAKEGIELTVVNARFAKPLDEELIKKLAGEQPFIITVEEHASSGGFGSAVLECLNRLGKDTGKTRCLGIPDKFIEHGNRAKLLASLGLDAEGIIKTVKTLVKK